VDGSSNEFKQVILNLLGNARDAILENRNVKGAPEQGRISVRISVNTKNSISIDVSDNGCGIPPDIAPHILDPYFTTKEKSGGTGLGLYMSRTIVEKSLGGSLRPVQSHEGATFRIELPLRKTSWPT
jgi:signal transduction histidine kinase